MLFAKKGFPEPKIPQLNEQVKIKNTTHKFQALTNGKKTLFKMKTYHQESKISMIKNEGETLHFGKVDIKVDNNKIDISGGSLLKFVKIESKKNSSTPTKM